MSTPAGLSRWLSGKEPTRRCRRRKGHGFHPWAGKIPWRGKWQSTPVFLPEKSHGQRSLKGYSSWGQRRAEWLNNGKCTSPSFWGHPLLGAFPALPPLWLCRRSPLTLLHSSLAQWDDLLAQLCGCMLLYAFVFWHIPKRRYCRLQMYN